MADLIKLRRGTAAEWAEVNPVLSLGEPGVEIDTQKIKYGDGNTPWNDLPYGSGVEQIEIDVNNLKTRTISLEQANEVIPSLTERGRVKLHTNSSGDNYSGLSVDAQGGIRVNTRSDGTYGLRFDGNGQLHAMIKRSATNKDLVKVGTAEASAEAAITVANLKGALEFGQLKVNGDPVEGLLFGGAIAVFSDPSKTFLVELNEAKEADIEGQSDVSVIMPSNFILAVSKLLGLKEAEDNKLYHKESDEYYPVSHPDISTQPSLLPQKFGTKKLYEVASRIRSIQKGIPTLDIINTTDNKDGANIVGIDMVEGTMELLFDGHADLKIPLNALYLNTGINKLFFKYNDALHQVAYDGAFDVVLPNGSKIIDVTADTDNYQFMAAVGDQTLDVKLVVYNIEYGLFYQLYPHYAGGGDTFIYYKPIELADITNDSITNVVIVNGFLQDVPSGVNIIQATAFNKDNCLPTGVEKVDGLWKLKDTLSFTPDFVLCQYYTDKGNYYYSGGGSGAVVTNKVYLQFPLSGGHTITISTTSGLAYIQFYGIENLVAEQDYQSNSSILARLSQGSSINIFDSNNTLRLTYDYDGNLTSPSSGSIGAYFTNNELNEIQQAIDANGRLYFNLV